MTQFITYLHLLTPLHTGGSAQEGNLMGIAREVHTEFPYLPSSSLRGKIRSVLEHSGDEEDVATFFGKKLKSGQQPTEGEVWFADATLLFFPIASWSHHFVWITCPLWLQRWNRWLPNAPLTAFVCDCRKKLSGEKHALTSLVTDQLFLQGAKIVADKLELIQQGTFTTELEKFTKDSDEFLSQLPTKVAIVTDEDCAALVETGLQREVRVALKPDEKIVKDGSFRSEEAIPPEAVLFFPWGVKTAKSEDKTVKVREEVKRLLNDRLQFGGLEGLGRGWAQLKNIPPNLEDNHES
ncbi:type III-B CRISPR module RAMP protein Cmr4 [Gloeobacter morelensis]|uniref:Type III-B CRISPR module RAMP protein Cmr4 n=1 Tax=Gloeobacter morelensis MG652769 TaxID=2781736 RepID=A0ABY3PM29_9CYAN|nr:type III-B CRISPR module RAMP protein Cmr4 [Gloeobacter morelensis]UFP94659.1 type III-B CRISPR module RAMP protein Cmr4 [Gloeobacter morelensis MG652769]